MKEATLPSGHELTDEQWVEISTFLDNRRRKRRHDLRDIVNAALWVYEDPGRKWRDLPGRYPPWQTVYYYASMWRKDGRWEQVSQVLFVSAMAA